MERETISIIVPVYNVELYLPRCLDSLLRQTYSALEIILVDDGSPDGSGAICDEYARRDGRIQVIHKKNGGVATARNAGLSAATGEYLAFVDGDDWAEEDMYAYLLKGLQGSRADVAVCGYFVDTNGGAREVGCGRETVLSGREVDGKTVQTVISPNCWNKLSRRALWEGIRFPEIRIGEDLLVTRLLCERADRIAVMPGAKYHYIQREGSAIMNQSLEKWLGHFDASRAWYEKMIGSMPERGELLADSCLYCAKTIWCICGALPRRERKAVMGRLREISRFCAPWIPPALARKEMGLTGQTALWLVQHPRDWAVRAAALSDRVYRRAHGAPL